MEDRDIKIENRKRCSRTQLKGVREGWRWRIAK